MATFVHFHRIFFVLVTLLIVLALDIATASERRSNVQAVSTRDFSDKVTNGRWFLEFYAPMCQHCRRLQPVWEEVATELQGEVNVGKVDCTQERALCDRFRIKRLPTLVHIDNQKTRKYQGAMNNDALCAFAREGYKEKSAMNLLKSPFGPIPTFKAYATEVVMKVHDMFLHYLNQGISIWVLFLIGIGGIALVTAAIAFAVVSAPRPKRD